MERHILGERCRSRKTVSGTGGRRNKNSLMQVASEHIAPLQDAVDLDIATEEEASLLAAWKTYRVLLNRVDTTVAADVEWPVAPIIKKKPSTEISMALCTLFIQYNTTLLVIYVQFDGISLFIKDIAPIFTLSPILRDNPMMQQLAPISTLLPIFTLELGISPSICPMVVFCRNTRFSPASTAK